MAERAGISGRAVFLAVLVALLAGALLVLWFVVKLAAKALLGILVGGLILIALIYFGLRRMFAETERR